MAKQVKELRGFAVGTKSSPASSDVNIEANVWAKNLDPITELGKLKGVKEHRKLSKEGYSYKFIWPYIDHANHDSSFTTDGGVDWDWDGGTYNEALLANDVKIKCSFDLNGTSYTHTNIIDVPTNTGGYGTALAHSEGHMALIITAIEGWGSAFTASKWYPAGNPGYSYYNGEYDSGGGVMLSYFYLDNGVFKWRTATDGNAQDSTVDASYLPNPRGIYISTDNTIKDLHITFYLKSGNGGVNYVEFDPEKLDANSNNEYILSNDSETPVTDDFYNVYNQTAYYEFNASEMELFNDEGQHNISFYSKTKDDTNGPLDTQDTYRMKVLLDCEGEQQVQDSYTNDIGETLYYDIPAQPDTVTLSKKNADVYIGAGNTEAGKTKWFGKIKHKQFTSSLDDYRLLDSELYPLDDGQAVFNLSYLSFGMHGSGTDYALDTDKVYGFSEGTPYLYALDNSSVTTSNPDKGVQVASDVLGFTPTTISHSYKAHNALNDLSNGTWTEDGQNIITGHTHTVDKSAYWWSPNANRAEIKLLNTEFDTTANTLVVNEIVTLNTSFGSNEAPPAGAKMTDILEIRDASGGTTSHIWCLYSMPDNTPFTFDQEWVYGFDFDTDIAWDTKNITMHPRTPSAFQAKKKNGGTMPGETLSGQDKYVFINDDCFKAELNEFKDEWADDWNYDAWGNRIGVRKVNSLGDEGDEVWDYFYAHDWSQWNGDWGTLDLGDGGGWHEEYEATPYKHGLIEADQGKVGLLCHFKGKLVTHNGKLNAGRKSDWPDRRYYIYPSKCGETTSVDETKVVYLKTTDLGVKHVRVSDSSSGNSKAGLRTSDIFTNGGDYHVRMAGYSIAAGDRLIVQGFSGNTEASGHPQCNDITNEQPITNILSVNKEPYLNDKLMLSVIGNQSNATTLMEWDFPYPSSPSHFFNGTLSPSSPATAEFEPMFLEHLGASAFACKDSASGMSFFFSPTMGQYIAAYGVYNTSSGWDTSHGGFETIAGYPNDYVAYLVNSKLDYGLTISDGDIVAGEDPHNFAATDTYYFKMSFLYDGYQESPLTTYYFKYSPIQNCNSVNIKIILFTPSPRVTDVIVYRKNNVEDYYRLIEQVSLEKGWGDTTLGDNKFKTIVDDGGMSATYEAITGMPESLRDTMVNYKLSTAAGGYLFVGNCFHKEITNGQNFIFRSSPNNFSSFDWSKNFLVLPNEPTALAYWAGRLFAFDKTNMYRIDVNNMVIEDDHKGVGCFGEESFVVTDYGMYFCDTNNIYLHDGNKVTPIATDILKSSLYDETDTKRHAWQNINHEINPRVGYDAFNQNIMIMWKDVDGTSGSWNYNIPRRRWDLMDIPHPESYVQGPNGQRFLSDGLNFYKLNESSIQKEWEFHTPDIDMQYATQEKKIKKLKFIFNSAEDLASAVYTQKIYIDGALVDTTEFISGLSNSKFEDDGYTRTFKIPNINKFRKIRVSIESCNVEIDAIGLIWTPSTVK